MKKYKEKECFVCGVVMPSNEMIESEEEVLSSRSGWGVNFGLMWLLGWRGVLGGLMAPRKNYSIVNRWYCQDCWQELKAEEKELFFKNILWWIKVLVAIAVIYYAFQLL